MPADICERFSASSSDDSRVPMSWQTARPELLIASRYCACVRREMDTSFDVIPLTSSGLLMLFISGHLPSWAPTPAAAYLVNWNGRCQGVAATADKADVSTGWPNKSQGVVISGFRSRLRFGVDVLLFPYSGFVFLEGVVSHFVWVYCVNLLQPCCCLNENIHKNQAGNYLILNKSLPNRQ